MLAGDRRPLRALEEAFVLRLPVIVTAAAAIVMGATIAHVRAARDDRLPAAATSSELLVFEVRSCTICGLVHQHIQPLYQQSSRAQQAPMRFVDLNETDETALGLVAPITTVPTIVLMSEGREVTRITGYTGPNIFFQVLNNTLGPE